VLRTLEDSHTVQFEASLDSYQTAKAVCETDAELFSRSDVGQKRVEGLGLKRKAVHEMTGFDFEASRATLQAGLAVFPDNGEIKLLLETLERKMRALTLKRQAEEFEEQVPSWSSWHMSC
jgi:hypothetical protein